MVNKGEEALGMVTDVSFGTPRSSQTFCQQTHETGDHLTIVTASRLTITTAHARNIQVQWSCIDVLGVASGTFRLQVVTVLGSGILSRQRDEGGDMKR